MSATLLAISVDPDTNLATLVAVQDTSAYDAFDDLRVEGTSLVNWLHAEQLVEEEDERYADFARDCLNHGSTTNWEPIYMVLK